MNKLKGLMSWGLGWRHHVVRAAAVLGALAILALYVAARQAAAPPTGTVDLTVNMPAFSNDLVEVGTPVTTHLTATVGSNYNPPVLAPDEGSLTDSYAWPLTVKFSSTGATGTYAITNSGLTTYTYSPDPIPSEASVPFTFTPHEAGYWQVSVSCAVTVTDTKTQFKWYGNGTAGPDDLTSAIVTFSPNPIETGADKIAGEADQIYTLAVAMVQPADLVSDVTVGNFVNSGAGRAAVDDTLLNAPDPGDIRFHVYGTAGTSASMPNGDIQMQAKDGDVVLGTAEVTVVIPAAIGTPHPTFNAAVAPAHRALNETTSPAAPGVSSLSEVLFTCALDYMVVPVWDQFGHPLGALYYDAEVDEQAGGSWITINQTMSAHGTYLDPVGVGSVATQNGQTVVVPLGNPNNVPWPAMASPQGPYVENIPVEVAGFQLNPGVVNRTVSYANGTLTITWP